MVSASLTAAAFVAMILPVFALDGLEKRGRIAALRLLAWIALVVALSCVAAGIAQHAGWGEPIMIAGRSAPYGPSGLIALGLFWAIVYAATLRRGPRP
jgi:fucose permease